MNNTNPLISGDNKGYASQLMEKRFNPTSLPGKVREFLTVRENGKLGMYVEDNLHCPMSRFIVRSCLLDVNGFPNPSSKFLCCLWKESCSFPIQWYGSLWFPFSRTVRLPIPHLRRVNASPTKPAANSRRKLTM